VEVAALLGGDAALLSSEAREHLESCPRCAAELERLAGALAAYRSEILARAERPESHWLAQRMAVRARLDERAQHNRLLLRWTLARLLLRWTLAASAGALLLVVAGGLFWAAPAGLRPALPRRTPWPRSRSRRPSLQRPPSSHRTRTPSSSRASKARSRAARRMRSHRRRRCSTSLPHHGTEEPADVATSRSTPLRRRASGAVGVRPASRRTSPPTGEPGEPGEPGGPGAPPAPADRWWRDHALLPALELPKEQRERLEATYESARGRLDTLDRQLVEAESSLSAATHSASGDAAAIARTLDPYLAARSALEVERMRLLLTLRSQLTPEQWQRLQRLQSEPRRGPGPVPRFGGNEGPPPGAGAGPPMDPGQTPGWAPARVQGCDLECHQVQGDGWGPGWSRA